MMMLYFRNLLIVSAVVVLGLGLSGCIASESLDVTAIPTGTPSDVREEPSPKETPLLPTASPTMEAPQATPTRPAPKSTEEEMEPLKALTPAEQEAVTNAKQSLVDKMSVSADEIELVSIESVQFRDTSLGCPKKGMMYLQVITPGYKVLLQVGEQAFDYRVAGQRVVLCGPGL